MHWLLFFTVLRYKTAIKAFRSKLLPFALFTTHTLLNKKQNGRKAQNASVCWGYQVTELQNKLLLAGKAG